MDHALSSKALDLIFLLGFLGVFFFLFFFRWGELRSLEAILREARYFALTQANLALVN